MQLHLFEEDYCPMALYLKSY